jgi:glycosyltransferase involved in cell wall biosynthesis
LVARITRQKGIDHFLNAAAHFNSDLQVLLCASAPDTSEMAAEVAAQVNRLQRDHGLDVAWADETVPIPDLVGLYSQAALFVCPSVYEPFGIINLEAMACGTPVVASAVGGIPEVVQDGVTGRLVPLTPVGPHNPQPRDPDRFARDLAAAVNELAADPDRLTEMGRRARQVVEKRFSWSAVARKTLDFYRALHRR